MIQKEERKKWKEAYGNRLETTKRNRITMIIAKQKTKRTEKCRRKETRRIMKS